MYSPRCHRPSIGAACWESEPHSGLSFSAAETAAIPREPSAVLKQDELIPFRAGGSRARASNYLHAPSVSAHASRVGFAQRTVAGRSEGMLFF